MIFRHILPEGNIAVLEDQLFSSGLAMLVRMLVPHGESMNSGLTLLMHVLILVRFGIIVYCYC